MFLILDIKATDERNILQFFKGNGSNIKGWIIIFIEV